MQRDITDFHKASFIFSFFPLPYFSYSLCPQVSPHFPSILSSIPRFFSSSSSLSVLPTDTHFRPCCLTHYPQTTLFEPTAPSSDVVPLTKATELFRLIKQRGLCLCQNLLILEINIMCVNILFAS